MDLKHLFDHYLQEASLLPLYDAGYFRNAAAPGVHGVMADSSFNPRAVMDDEAIEFTKTMGGHRYHSPDLQPAEC